MRHSSRDHVETDSIYERCMELGQSYDMTARDVSLALESPFALYCQYHVDIDNKDPDDEFGALLRDRGITHELETKTVHYQKAVHVKSKTQEKGFADALNLMVGGTDLLDNPPIFYRPEGMHGRPDVLVKQDGVSALGDHHYEVVEIKMAKNLKQKHILQAAFYNKMIGLVQRHVPERFFIIGGDSKIQPYNYADYVGNLDSTIDLARSIHNGYVPPPIYGQTETGWTQYSNEKAVESGSVTLISGIGMGKVHTLNSAGFKTIQDVASSTEADLASIKGIKTQSSKFIALANAITTNKMVRLDGKIDLPECSTEIFIDLEGLGLLEEESIHDYLIGVLVRNRKNGCYDDRIYKYFIAKDKREDLMLERFVKFMDSQDDYIMYHWNTYERTYLRSMMERHGIDAYRLLEQDVLVDLLPISKKAFAFPTYSNSLKDVAKWMGYGWKHSDVGALSSIILYLKYIDDPTNNWDSIQKVLDYNMNDCEATRIVKDWMLANS